MVDLPIFPYTAVQLTGTINRTPNVYGLLNDLDLFPRQGIASRIVEVRRENNLISVLSSREIGGPPVVQDRSLGNALYFGVPHFPLQDVIKPQDLQSWLMVVGNTAEPNTLELETAKRLRSLRNRHAITLEWLRLQALLGNITDGDGNLIYNLYTAFGITQSTVDFNFSSSTADITGATDQVIDTVQKNLLGETSTGVEVICSTLWFNSLISHPNTVKYFVNFEGKRDGSTGGAAKMVSQDRIDRGGQWGRTFEFQGITYREYKGYVPVRVAGVLTNVSFMSGLSAVAYPVGTTDMFRTYFAPADDLRYANTLGLDVYVSPDIKAHGKGVELLTESNPLPLVRRPEAVVLLTSIGGPTAGLTSWTPSTPAPGLPNA